MNARSKIIITTDEGKRGGKMIGIKNIVDEALKQCPDITNCIVFKQTGADVPWSKGRDLWWHEEVEKYPNYLAPESMDSEDPLSFFTPQDPPESQRVSCTLPPAILWVLE